jgi:hypothetical protein
MEDPVKRIVASCPISFFQNLQEETDAGFTEAFRLTQAYVAEPEQANMLGQHRHAHCEEGFRRAAQAAGLSVFSPHTEPLGSRYSLAQCEGIYFLRGNIQKHCGTPRATCFRKLYAEFNEWLHPIQEDFFLQVPNPPNDKLCAFLVTTAFGKREDQTVPAFLGIGIPNSDLSDWIDLKSIPELIALYHDADTRSRTMKERPVEIKDQVIPKLKKSNNSPKE